MLNKSPSLNNVDGNVRNLNADQLEALYSPTGGGQHPHFTRADWREAVAGDDTISGYWPWVHGRIQDVDADCTDGQPAGASEDHRPEGEPGVRQLQFVATIHGVVNVNDGFAGEPEVTEEQLVGQIEGAIAVMTGNGGLTGGTPAVVDCYDVNVRAGNQVAPQFQTLEMLRSQGYAVVVFTPDELGTADRDSLQDRLVELGNEAISLLRT